MLPNKWLSWRVLIGGSIIALIAVLWGILNWNVLYWLIIVISAPFVLSAAMFHDRRIYLYILCIYVLAHVGVHVWTRDRSFLLSSNIFQWISLIVAGEVVFQISSQRRRAEQVAQRHIREMEVMNETLAEISSELGLNTLLQIIVERAVILINAPLGELLLRDEQSGEMKIMAQFPVDKSQIGLLLLIKSNEGALGHVAVNKRPLLLNDYKTFANALPGNGAKGIEATLVVPLLKGDEFIGVLGVAHFERNRKFTLNDQNLLAVFANQATVAIENARLYKQVQYLAFTDVLTGIHNRRRLFELAEMEYRRSMRYRRPLSFMIVDIDHFKNINDSYGHLVGDKTLEWFAMECISVIRQNVDVIGRFGGEEFAVIYPETDLLAAVTAAERLRRHLAERKFSFPGHELQITFSAGIASLPFDEDIELDQLVERADKALYLAKQQRNCLAQWDDGSGAPLLIVN